MNYWSTSSSEMRLHAVRQWNHMPDDRQDFFQAGIYAEKIFSAGFVSSANDVRSVLGPLGIAARFRNPRTAANSSCW
jgi:hypothetical protein